MSRTSQRKRQAYQEGLQHGMWQSGHAYSRHPFMAEYRKGYADGVIRAKYIAAARREQKAKQTWLGRFIDWVSRRFA